MEPHLSVDPQHYLLAGVIAIKLSIFGAGVAEK
jgi:hypothetical protein